MKFKIISFINKIQNFFFFIILFSLQDAESSAVSTFSFVGFQKALAVPGLLTSSEKEEIGKREVNPDGLESN